METIRFNFVSRVNTFFTIIAIIFAICLSNGNYSFAQTTKTVGIGGNYTTLKSAFDAINAGTITGSITLQIIDNTTETGAAILNASGSGSASYTSINIYPTTTGLTISGDLNAPLIDLNGVNNVTINGSLNGANTGKDLTITNTRATMYPYTIRFAGGASSNTVKYCTLKGSSTSNSGGVLFFSSGGNNSNNIIDNNNITNSGGNRPINAIFSYGGSGNNIGNTISNNNIYDFFNAGTSSQGIYISDYSSDWSITGNNFYETTTLVPTAQFYYYVIRVDDVSGNNFTISDNIIGGSAADHSGTFTLNSAQSHTFYGLYLNVGTTTASSVQNNTIKSISSTSTSDSPFRGMFIIGGNVNIGTVTGNTIGSTTGNGSITLTNSTTNSDSRGINNQSSGTVNIQKNSIGSITTVGSATISNSFYGISSSGGTISDNTIGSTDAGTTNSIWASSSTSGSQTIYGIVSGANTTTISGNIVSKLTNAAIGTSGRLDGITIGNGTNTVTNNTIHDLTSAAITNAVRGIALNSNTAAAQTVTGNTIYNLSNTNTSFTGNVTGIYYQGPTTAGTVSKNFIYNLSVSASSTNAWIYGIQIASGVTSYSNNIISLGGDTKTTICGIYETGAASNNNNLYFNTVYIGGTVASGNNKSYALFSVVTTNTRNFRNNIFFNARSTTSGNNLHYAAYFNYGSSSNLTLDYNDYYVTGIGGKLGYYNSANVTSLPLIASNDANSKNTNPSLASAGGTTAANYLPSANTLNAVSGTGITTDYAGTTRIYNSMGAYDYAVNSITVNATSGSSTGYYLTLKTAFDAINAGIHQGAITIYITGSTIETASAYLRASGSGSAIYTSVNIYPTVSGLTISGNLDAPLIDLNGANNVTINGSLNGANAGKDLTITNTSTTNSTSTSTIRFVGGAASNTVKYCTLNGSSTATYPSEGGVLLFSSGGNNSNNIIDNNNITNAGGNRPINAIYSYGGSGFTNSGNTISNNNIYDFFNAGVSSQGIYIWNYSSNWSITGNDFYETTTFAPTGTFTYYAICIDGGSGNNFTVTDNFIGGSASDHTGTFTLNSAQSHTFYGIYLRVVTTTASSVQNNTIKSIASTSTSDRPFFGMSIYGGNVNIGTVTGNTIGSTTGNGSITLTNSTSNSTNSYGIYSTMGTADIQKNNIGSITTVGSETVGHSFYGIYTAGGIYTISNNTIGSTDDLTTNSIWASSPTTGSQYISGIGNSGSAIISGNIVSKLTNAGTGTYGRMDGITSSHSGINTVTNNTVHDLTSALNTSDEAVRGIYLFSSTAAVQTISGNTIYNLSNTNTSLKGYVTGIYHWETTTTSASIVSKNFIYNLSVSASSTAATIYGIYILGGAATYSNNMISLGGNTPTTIYGIYERGTSGNNNLYFNTVYIGGVPTSGSNKSYALYSEYNTNTRDFRNNIFMNARTNGEDNEATGKHYSVYFATSGSTGLTQNNNDYYATAAAGNFLGYFNGADVITLDAWKTATGQDGYSTNKSVNFVSATDLHLSGGSIGDFSLTGTPIDGITTDYFGTTRNVTYPYMGGNDVTNSPLPVLLASLNSIVDGRNVKLNWVTSSEVNNAGFDVERAEFRSENLEFRKIGFIAGKGTINTPTSYTFSDTKLNSGKYKYRLKQIDNNGNFQYHNLNGEIEIGVPTKFELSQNYPNPFNPTTKIDFALPNDSKVSIKVYDMTGREVMDIMNNEFKTAGYYTININPSMLSSGVYFYRMISDKFIETKKMLMIK